MSSLVTTDIVLSLAQNWSTKPGRCSTARGDRRRGGLGTNIVCHNLEATYKVSNGEVEVNGKSDGCQHSQLRYASSGANCSSIASNISRVQLLCGPVEREVVLAEIQGGVVDIDRRTNMCRTKKQGGPCSCNKATYRSSESPAHSPSKGVKIRHGASLLHVRSKSGSEDDVVDSWTRLAGQGGVV